MAGEAVSAPRALDLPVGSVVRSPSGDLVATKRPGSRWWVSGLGDFFDYEINQWLDDGGQVRQIGGAR